MKCKDCVLEQFEDDSGRSCCGICPHDTSPHSQDGVWLDRDCVRDLERNAKLKEQLEA